ncbi:SRPBCC family protein [Gillisia marina]|uniref:SRPBCC family protein n=1 Tax=Gillisia marina TaxID=1167637 RepID=UPI00029ACB6F|nr:SRPBCC family protein [Gillisia marina]
MKYSKEIIIDLPREEVIAKMEDPNNFKHWQKGFVSYKHISGKAGHNDARSKLKYKMGKRNIEMVETIEKNNLPSKLFVSYDAKGVFNRQKNYFEEVDSNSTKWISDNEFECSGFMKIIAFLMPGSFKNQTYKYMKDFKAFAENGTSVLNE